MNINCVSIFWTEFKCQIVSFIISSSYLIISQNCNRNAKTSLSTLVHDQKGNDLFDRIFKNLMKTIQEGGYYLGTNSTTSISQINAIAFTSNHSNIVNENYPVVTIPVIQSYYTRNWWYN